MKMDERDNAQNSRGISFIGLSEIEMEAYNSF